MTDEEIKALREAALAVARRVHFGEKLEPCWCNGVIKPVCVGQPQCHAARIALGYERKDSDAAS